MVPPAADTHFGPSSVMTQSESTRRYPCSVPYWVTHRSALPHICECVPSRSKYVIRTGAVSVRTKATPSTRTERNDPQSARARPPFTSAADRPLSASSTTRITLPSPCMTEKLSRLMVPDASR
jgi:hypothetical protein